MTYYSFARTNKSHIKTSTNIGSKGVRETETARRVICAAIALYGLLGMLVSAISAEYRNKEANDMMDSLKDAIYSEEHLGDADGKSKLLFELQEKILKAQTSATHAAFDGMLFVLFAAQLIFSVLGE